MPLQRMPTKLLNTRTLQQGTAHFFGSKTILFQIVFCNLFFQQCEEMFDWICFEPSLYIFGAKRSNKRVLYKVGQN